MTRARRGLSGWLALACLLFFCLAFGAASASAAVYWGSARNGVGAANLDGSNPVWDYFYWPFTDESSGPACGVAVDSTHLYWAGWQGIGRRALEGESLYPATIVGHIGQSCGLTVDATHLYWGSPETGSLGRANLDGSQPNRSFVSGLDRPCDVAIGSGHVFWMEREGIGRANLDGSDLERSFVALPPYNDGCGLAVAGHYLYWGELGSIYRLDLQSEDPPEQLIDEVGGVEGITLDAGHIYWSNAGSGAVGSIGRADLDGSDADPRWIVAPENNLGGVAVDGRPTPPAMTLPSRPILFTRNAEYNLRAGAAQIGIYVPGQGDLRVTSPGLAWKVFRSDVPRAAWAGAYLWQVRFRPGSGRVGKRIRAQLQRRGWAPVTLRLEYTQDRVYPVTAKRRFVLRRYPGAAPAWVKHPHRPRR